MLSAGLSPGLSAMCQHGWQQGISSCQQACQQDVCRAVSRVSAGLPAGVMRLIYRLTRKVLCAAGAGSYAVEVDGAGRTREVREMVQGLHGAGLRVVLDVVYNHTFNSGVHHCRPWHLE